MKNKIDIIIVTYNAKRLLAKCLRSVIAHTKRDFYDLTVVDNCSDDGTEEFLRRFRPKIRVIRTKKNKGFSSGANIGVRATSNNYIALLDDDIEIGPRQLERLYRQLISRKNVGIVGGKIVYPSGLVFSADFSIKHMICQGRGEWDRGQRNYVKEADAMAGPCWLMRRKVFDDVGYFNEDYFPSQAEDIEYCLRTRLAGFKILYDGRISIVHHHLFRDGGNLRRNNHYFHLKWRKIINELPFSDSSRVDKYFEQGLICFEKKEFQKALQYFQKTENQIKGYVGPFYMAASCFRTGRQNEARKYLKQAFKLYDPAHYLYQRSVRCLFDLYKEMGLNQKMLDMVIKLRTYGKL